MAKPTKNNREETAKSFYEKWEFPNTIGKIVGKHIRIKCPPQSGSVYYSYKHYFSVVLQGFCDSDYRFVCIEVGGFGKQSDVKFLITEFKKVDRTW
ncbi:hypothetical protein ANN_30197 [Periplaneta americana]|uniref:DDE Tnp4 domain-containing protein n=1 Tax=Periplaneta americana TaxID=6978 RepID=A0ABQ8SM70_PERAM|nr:hypothetical protein ANN_30197 [Periplaneta americana]